VIRSNIFNSSTVAHAFFTREGGVSTGLYQGLNCGAGSNDAPDNVTTNKRIAMTELGRAPEELVTLYQIHSTDVLVIDAQTDLNSRVKADAMVSRTPDIALGILTADCVPVLFADTDNGVIGAAHSGWKGALGNISANVIDAMIKLGARRDLIKAAIGPAIQQASYEVGPEFPAPFIEKNADYHKFFTPSINAGHHMFDLTGFVKSQIKSEKINAVDLIKNNTCTEENLFFSYRRMYHRSETDYGRQLSVIALRNEK